MSGLRPYFAGFWFGGFNGLTWMIGLGTPLVLLAQQLGATTFQVGLASSLSLRHRVNHTGASSAATTARTIKYL